MSVPTHVAIIISAWPLAMREAAHGEAHAPLDPMSPR